MSGWETPHARWSEWIERDVGLQHPVWVSCDEFDDNLRNLLEARPFADGRAREDGRREGATLRPLLSEGSAARHFDGSTAALHPTVFSAEAEASGGAGWAASPGATAWAIDPPSGAGDSGAGVAPALSEPELEGLFIPALTRPALEVATAPQGAPTPLPILDFSSELPLGEDEAVPVPAGADVAAIEAPWSEPEVAPSPGATPATEEGHSYEAAPASEEGHSYEAAPVSEEGHSYEAWPASEEEPAFGAAPSLDGEAGSEVPPSSGRAPGSETASSTAEGIAESAEESRRDDVAPHGAPSLELSEASEATQPLPEEREGVTDTSATSVPRPWEGRSVSGRIAIAPELDSHMGEEASGVDVAEPGSWSGPAFVHHGEQEIGALQAMPRAESESAAIELDEAEFVEEHEFQEVDEVQAAAAERKGPPAPPPVRDDAAVPEEVPDRETTAALAVLQAQRDSLSATELEQRVAQLPSPGAAWFEEVFGEHFAALTRPSHGRLAHAEVDFFLSMAGLSPGARILDVGCGDGAHAIVLAQRGFDVTGLDLSAAQLLRAAKAADALHAPVRWVHADMRRSTAVEVGSMDAIVCLGTTFGYFDEEENRRVLQRWRDWLAPQGRALIQVANRDHVVARLPARSWWQGRNCLVLDESEMDFYTNRLHVQRNIAFNDGRQFKHDMSIRVYSAYDLGHMCAAAGLRVVEISGSRHTRARFYGATSPEIWLLVERLAS